MFLLILIAAIALVGIVLSVRALCTDDRPRVPTRRIMLPR